MTRDHILDVEIAHVRARLGALAGRLAALAGVLHALRDEHDQCIRGGEGEDTAAPALQAARAHDEQLGLLLGQERRRLEQLLLKRKERP